LLSGEDVEKREGHTTETPKNIEELASVVQDCRLERVGPSDGGSHVKAAPTSAHFLGWSECNILKLPDGDTIKFGTLNWANVSE